MLLQKHFIKKICRTAMEQLQQFHIKMMTMPGFQPLLPSDSKQGAVLPLGPLDQASRDIYSLTGRVDTPTQS